MDSGIITLASTFQLIALAGVAVIVLILGARVAGMGPRGFASLLGEIGALLVGIYIVARPNDFIGLLLKSVGGVQTISMPK